MADILIVEDDRVFSELLAMHLEDVGHKARIAGGVQQARQLLGQQPADAVLLDQQLPDGLGIDLLHEIAAEPDRPPVIVITGVSDNTLAIEAMRQGAYDFIRKPMDELELDTTLANALRTHRLTRKVSATMDPGDHRAEVHEIVGSSPGILDVCKTVGAVAARAAPVLITGESGTGKELVARAIHHHSGRSGRFLPINCAALAENLLESELFGHERGSFTGAVARKDGKFELASDGTLFLDELGEMPYALQAKLLRVLQDGTFARVGGVELLRSDARIIAATNGDPQEMVRQGRLREDLFYRLNVVQIHLPPLRARMQDLPTLTEHLLRKVNAKQHTSIRHVAREAWQRLKDYPWRGNIRELENVLTRAAVLARGETLTPDLLALPLNPEADKPPEHASEQVPTLRLISLEELEREHIRAILAHVRWHKGKACEILRISRPALDRKIDKYHLALD
ncbi:MAG: sigma-54 dependent transcriptional regulator [Chromatiaceae bacterium]